MIAEDTIRAAQADAVLKMGCGQVQHVTFGPYHNADELIVADFKLQQALLTERANLTKNPHCAGSEVQRTKFLFTTSFIKKDDGAHLLLTVHGECASGGRFLSAATKALERDFARVPSYFRPSSTLG